VFQFLVLFVIKLLSFSQGHVASDPTCPLGRNISDPEKIIQIREEQLRQGGGLDNADLVVTFQRQVDKNDPNNQLIEDDDEEDAGELFLASLSKGERKLLLKHLSRAAGGDEKKKKKKRKKKKKKKKKKRKRESD